LLKSKENKLTEKGQSVFCSSFCGCFKTRRNKQNPDEREKLISQTII